MVVKHIYDKRDNSNIFDAKSKIKKRDMKYGYGGRLSSVDEAHRLLNRTQMYCNITTLKRFQHIFEGPSTVNNNNILYETDALYNLNYLRNKIVYKSRFINVTGKLKKISIDNSCTSFPAYIFGPIKNILITASVINLTIPAKIHAMLDDEIPGYFDNLTYTTLLINPEKSGVVGALVIPTKPLYDISCDDIMNLLPRSINIKIAYLSNEFYISNFIQLKSIDDELCADFNMYYKCLDINRLMEFLSSHRFNSSSIDTEAVVDYYACSYFKNYMGINFIRDYNRPYYVY